ncbi:MAG TPA: hypothetical protein PK691_00805 [Thermomicrobiales bacterium]|nr:hypothetical protein [Thermomicrobiales bacterium]
MTDQSAANSRLRTHLEHELTEQVDQARTALAAITATWNQISNLRLIAVLPVIGLAFWWLRAGDHIWLALTAVAIAIFVGTIIWHSRIGARRTEAQRRLRWREHQQARFHRDWDHLPPARPIELAVDHPYANDLDLVGPRSLLQLIDTTGTDVGFKTLGEWISQSSSIATATERQTSARALVGEGTWREDLAVAAMDSSPIGAAGVAANLAVFAARPITLRHIIGMGSTTLMVLGVVLAGLGWLPVSLLLVLVVINLGLTFSMSAANDPAAAMGGLCSLRRVLPVMECVPEHDPGLSSLRSSLFVDHRPASGTITAFDRRLSLVVPKGSLLWFPLQLATNWDLLVDFLLIRAARGIGPHVDRWIATLGQMEALSALANLAALNPGWAWPSLAASAPQITLQEGGHPLIQDERRVTNSVTIGPEGSVMIVTGSNMAGKSTLLRTVGLNAVLARAGGPVCAEAMTMGDFAIWSSVRIQDSLAQGVSLFMAELVRLRQIVDAARERPVLYLLDEILHGTNTSERRTAARMVIWHLLRTHGVGMVSSHDLELIDGDLRPHADLIHLVDQIRSTDDGSEMWFDYKVRPGLAPSSNALRLLELVGLGMDTD